MKASDKATWYGYTGLFGKSEPNHDLFKELIIINEVETIHFSRRAGTGYFGRHIVTSGKPAKFLRDALMTGNGQHRLLVFGDPANETMVLCQEDLYIPSWKVPPTAPACAEVLDEVRQLLLKGQYEEASYRALYSSLAKGVSDKHHPPKAHPAFVMKIKHLLKGSVRDYFRSVNLHNSVVTVRWAENSGTWKRESLVPRAGENIALTRLTGPENVPLQLRLSILKSGPQNLLYTLDGEHPRVAETSEPTFDWGTAPVDKTARLDPLPRPPEMKVELLEDAILITGTYEARFEKGGYAAAILVKSAGASLDQVNDEMVIISSGPVTLLMKAAPFAVQAPADAANLLQELRSTRGDFGEIVAANEKIHGAMFARLEVSFDSDPADYLLTTGELMEKQRLSQGINPVYMEKMVDMGRYFLLCESGKWPPIYGHVNININHQVSSANIGALPEMLEVFMRWIEWQLPDARENSRLVFGAGGFLMACHLDTESGKLYHFNHHYPHHYWISGSGWVLQPFLEYYYCTGDEEFLKSRLLPLYVELAQFYRDYLKLTGDNGKWIFAPSYSPENWPSNTLVQTAINATMDITVCREVLETLLNLAPAVGLGTPEQMATWQNMLEKLPDYLIGTHGELKEWAWPTLEERYDHRHLSHLYGAYPGDEFQPEKNPEIYKAAFIANRMRAQENSSAHGIAHRAQIAGRLKDPYLVFQNLKQLLETGFVNDSFSTRHNPYVAHYMPDAQGALPTIVLEALIYSRPGILELLPALPWCWPKGTLKGMAARTFVRINELSWDLNSGKITLVLTPLKSHQVELVFRPGFDRVSLKNTGILLGAKNNRCSLFLEAGQQVTILFELDAR